MSGTYAALTAALFCAALAGCAGPRLIAADALSKSKGSIRFEKAPRYGTRIDLKVENLPEPEGLYPPGYSFVGWVQGAPDSPAQNVGALKVDDYRTGELKTSTPLRHFDFFMTVEATSDAARPSDPALLRARYDETVVKVPLDAETASVRGEDRGE